MIPPPQGGSAPPSPPRQIGQIGQIAEFVVEAVLFDLDGTLADTVPDLAVSVDAMLEVLGRARCGEDAVRNWVGNGVEVLVSRALGNGEPRVVDQALHKCAMAVFLPIYEANNGRHSRLYPGVVEGLEALSRAGHSLGCVTNKPRAFTLPLLEMLGLGPRFMAVVSGDDTAAKKPDPTPLRAAAEQLGCSIVDTLLVGDSVHDVQAARNAGIKVIGVPYGYNHGKDIREAKPDRVIASLAELPSLVGRKGESRPSICRQPPLRK